MNDFAHVSVRDLGEGQRVTPSPARTALNLFDDRYDRMIAMRLPQALALRDWLNEHFPVTSTGNP